MIIAIDGDPQAIANAVQRAIHDGDPNLAVRITRLSELVTTSIAPHRLIAVLLTAFAVLGVALATLGVFGVTSYLAAKRKRELTIRVALGASRLHVLGLALREGALSTMIGLSIGLLASLGVARLVASELYGVRPTDFAAFALAATVLSTTALIATLIPARSAMQVDPMAVLRQS